METANFSFSLSCHPVVGITENYTTLTLTMNMAATIFAETENYQHSMWCIPKSQSYIR